MRQLLTYQEMLSDGNLRMLLEYCPQVPHPKQLLFLKLMCKEALFGGAAGPGKSSALLMAALQYVHVPRYAALILRKDSQRLKLSGGLIPRSMEWLTKRTGSVGSPSWNGTDKRWMWSNGASIQFGYLDSTDDKYRYGSSEYQYIAFDELTEFPEEDYVFLFSRLRMTTDMQELGLTYRIRAASNPGGQHGDWVKQRFVPDEAEMDRKNECLKDVYWTKDKED